MPPYQTPQASKKLRKQPGYPRIHPLSLKRDSLFHRKKSPESPIKGRYTPPKKHFRVDKNGEVIEATHRTNPNSQWDWWVVGGRYSNRILRKSVEGEHDSAKVSDIDWEEMRKRSANKFNVNYLLGVFGYVKDGV